MAGLDLLALAVMVGGCLFFLAGTAGLLRFPDTLTRLHALTKADNMGLGLICVGLALHDRSISGIILLAFVWLLAMLSATLSAFLIARWYRQEEGEAR